VSDLVGTPEGELLQDIDLHQHRVGLATDEAASAEQHLANQAEALDRRIGDASVQLVLMQDAPNVSEGQKLAFAAQLLSLQGKESLDIQSVMAQFDRFAPGGPIISVSEIPFVPRMIMSESRIGIRPGYKGPGLNVSIDCRTRQVNHHKDEDQPGDYIEFDTSIDITRLTDVVIGLPAFQEYIDAFPGSIPSEKKARVAYSERLSHVFSSIEDMEKLGIEGVNELETKRLRTIQSLVSNAYEEDSWYQPHGRSGYGWWPRH